MKTIDINIKLIDAKSFEFLNPLSLVANSLRAGLRNELEPQVQDLYIHIKKIITYYLIFIYILIYVFFTRLRAYACARAQWAYFSSPNIKPIGNVAGKQYPLFLQGVSQ